MKILKDILGILIMVVFIQSFFIQGYGTPTGSMQNTISTDDKMFFNQFIYGPSTPRTIPFLSIIGHFLGKDSVDVKIPFIRFPAVREPRRGDIVNFEWPGNRDEVKSNTYFQYLKRIVGEPGDTIQIINRLLYVNGKIFQFPAPPDTLFDSKRPQSKFYVDPRIFPNGSPWNEDWYGPLAIPKKGDLITLTQENIMKWDTFIKRAGHKLENRDGKIFIDGVETNTYAVEQNYYFCMGDHRDNSLDCRFWGFVPRDNIVAKALIIYWNWDNLSRVGKLLK